jgi:hypothetical protein
VSLLSAIGQFSVKCTGLVTGHPRDLGVEVFGIDLSQGMIEIVRRDHPNLKFDVDSVPGSRLRQRG